MTNAMKKGMVVATCKNCGKSTDISESSEVQKLRASYITLREERADWLKNTLIMRANKNGQIQAMNVTIKKLLNIMSPLQRQEAYKEVKMLRGKLKQKEAKNDSS